MHNEVKEIDKMKRQPSKYEKKNLLNDMTIKRLISKIYKQPIKLHLKEGNSKNGQNAWPDTFPKKIYRWPTGIHNKMFNIANHQGNENKNHN